MSEGLPHLDDDEYEWAHTDGHFVTVRVDERTNGGDIRAYLYDEDWNRKEYFRFAIENIDAQKIHLRHGGEDAVVPDAVDAALWAGGWRYTNLYPAGVTEADPVYVSMLDVRDKLEAAAGEVNDRHYKVLCRSLARICEESAVALFETGSQAKAGGVDEATEDGAVATTQKEIMQVILTRCSKAIADEHMALPQTPVMLAWAEGVRRQLRLGEDIEDALEKARPAEIADGPMPAPASRF